MPALSAAAIRPVSASRDIIVPVGLAGLPTSTPFSGVLLMGREQGFAGQRVTGLARGLDQHRFAAERGQDMAIRRIAGNRHGDAVARLEHGEKAQDERARRSRRDHDPLGIHGAAVRLAVMPGDTRAERGNAQRRGIVDPTELEAA